MTSASGISSATSYSHRRAIACAHTVTGRSRDTDDLDTELGTADDETERLGARAAELFEIAARRALEGDEIEVGTTVQFQVRDAANGVEFVERVQARLPAAAARARAVVKPNPWSSAAANARSAAMFLPDGEILLPGHDTFQTGADHIRRLFTVQAEFLRTIVEQDVDASEDLQHVIGPHFYDLAAVAMWVAWDRFVLRPAGVEPRV